MIRKTLVIPRSRDWSDWSFWGTCFTQHWHRSTATPSGKSWSYLWVFPKLRSNSWSSFR